MTLRRYCLALLATLFFPLPVLATTEFSTNVTNTYHFDPQGGAQITHHIDLTNNLSHIYPTTYNLGISSGNINNIAVTVQNMAATPVIDQQPSTTTIHIPIDNPKIGKDQTTSLTISYETSSFAEKIGNTYTLTLPKTNRGNEAKSFVRQVILPASFPELSYSSLPPQTSSTSGELREYRFVGSGDQNLTLHFGTSASYDLSLQYLLKNTTGTRATSELALPPDTAYQQVILNELRPEPLEIVVDNDGNWLARYDVDPLTTLAVTAKLTVTVAPNPIYFDPSSSTPLDNADYWEQSSAIKRLATTLKTPENLYNYLLETLTYDYTQITRQQRLGADAALNAPQSAICTEFTDLFVATSRAMGIPSRAIIGYAVTSNRNLRPQGAEVDILHAYPEYLEPASKTWRSVDPTWGHTTGGSEYFDLLDFGHIAFVRWGNSSSYPLPAGSYRQDRMGKQLELTVRETPPVAPPVSYRLDTQGGRNYLVNTGQAALINHQLTLSDHEVTVPYLPPYGRYLLPSPSQTRPSQLLLIATPLALTALTIAFLFWRKRRQKVIR